LCHESVGNVIVYSPAVFHKVGIGITENAYIFVCLLTEQLDGLEQALHSQTTMGKKAKIDIEQFCYESDLQQRISELSADNDN